MTKYLIPLVGCLIAFSFQAAAQTLSPQQWLTRMQQSSHDLNYQFSYVALHQGRSEPIRLSHVSSKGKDMFAMEYLNGPVRQYIRRDNKVSFFEPDHQPYTLNHTKMPGLLPALFNMPLPEVFDSYHALLAGQSRVVGRQAQIVRLAPESADKYSYVLWLDQDNGLLLRVDVLTPQGQLVGQYLGVTLDVMQKPTKALLALFNLKLPKTLEASDVYQAPQRKLDWSIGWLPQGFKVISRDRHLLVGVNQPVDYMMAYDGLVLVSIYVAPVTATTAEQKQLVRLGSTNLFTFVNSERMKVTVVGQIPAQSALHIAESVRLKLPSKTQTEQPALSGAASS
ncbi:MucB/RseB C-terminal domain-containing protein [Dongshaea marina]|uniref:MucB/RseB C-terminal domain-containing protein n=1 Tax=Dongshaea marina TaxID=2047966 RepID=UPI000D3E2734|nr:MucB/RseB C-terminal domain-containing protein [Dongshaea marina]